MFEIEIFIVISMILSGTPANAFVCPTVEEVSPCTCLMEYEWVDCYSEGITQDVLNRVIAAIRRENNGALELSSINVRFTNVVELDLTPLEGGIFSDGLTFAHNSLLSGISGPDLDSTNWNPIQTRTLRCNSNNFQEEGLQTILSYFNRTEITRLDLDGNKLRGSMGPEFLQGFPELTNVEDLILSYNNIRVLGGGQFRGMSRVHTINLTGNGLEEIGEDAFLIDEVDDLIPYNLLYIYLNNNSLSDESFHPNSGIANISREYTELSLYDNQFRTMKEDRFLDFLEARPDNWLDFTGNPIWCDPEMKWLKDRREEFEDKVTGLRCINDPRETAFTSSCVDGDCECPPYKTSNPPTFYPGTSCDTYYMCTDDNTL